MKYAAPIMAMAALVAAQSTTPAFTNEAFNVVEGEPFTLRFSGCEGGCTISLQTGESDNLKDFRELTSSASGSSFTFTPSDMPTDTYNFYIVNNDSGADNWSMQFEYEGEAAPSSTTTTTAAPTTTTEESSTSTTEESTTTEESSTTTSEATTTTEESSTMTTASTTTTTSEATTTTEEASSTESPTDIPDPDGGAGSLGIPLTFAAAVAGLLLLN